MFNLEFWPLILVMQVQIVLFSTIAIVDTLGIFRSVRKDTGKQRINIIFIYLNQKRYICQALN